MRVCFARRFFGGGPSESAALALEARRDVVVHAWSDRWRLKAAFLSRTVASAALRHDLSEERDLRELSEAMTAAMIGWDCKGEERVTVALLGEGREVLAEALPAVGEVRGFVRVGAEGRGLARGARVAYGASEAASSTVEGREASRLMRAQGLATVVWARGGAAMEQSAAVAVEAGMQKEFQERLDRVGMPREGELPSEYVARVAGKDEFRAHRVWTTFHCRCVLPSNAASFAASGEVLVCHYCAAKHVVP